MGRIIPVRPVVRFECKAVATYWPVPAPVQRQAAIWADPDQLKQIVLNLILNAIDAMPKGGRLSLRTRRQGDLHVVFTVTDTGMGMSDEVRKRIFDPFFTTKGEEGTGLGLPVSYSIVKRHAGEMRVESRPGDGTTFTIVLPVGTVPVAEPPASAPPPVTERTGRVLLVDNEPQVMTILGEMLREAGHHVVPVASGAEALRVFLPGRFDLVLTNVGMAGMNGWELAERIRARDAEVPLVFITGWGLHEEDQARCRGLRISSLLFKPVRPDQLHATVQAVLGDPQRREDPAAPPRAPS